MSISGLANIAAPTIPPPSQPISAAVTRILTLSNFSPTIKTRDLHQAFQPWAEDKGGYKIKWIDDVTALVVFNDATTAKKAYLSMLLTPPTALPPPANIRPYDGPDSAAIIHSVNARGQGHGRTSFGQGGAGPQNGRPSFSQSQMQGILPGLTAGMGSLPSAFGGAALINGGFGAGVVPAAPVMNAGFKHGRSASVSSAGGSGERPITGSSGGSAAFNKLGGGAFSGFGGASTGSGGSLHGRQTSSSSASGSGSWGRHSISGVPGGINGINNNPIPPPQAHSAGQGTGHNSSRLTTHHETESPTGTPVKAGFKRGSQSEEHLQPHPSTDGTRADMSSPGIDVIGAMGPEGGPGGRAEQ